MNNCTCYVRFLSDHARFCLHHGAHNPTCPKYHPSLDPIDRQDEVEYRAEVEPQVGRSLKGHCPMPSGLAS